MPPPEDAVRRDVLQWGQYPIELLEVVEAVRYRPGWSFHLENLHREDMAGAEFGGLTLRIYVSTTDTYDPKVCEVCGNSTLDYKINHVFPVPSMPWNHRSWLFWVYERVLDVERHEATELFTLEVGTPLDPKTVRPFPQVHVPDENPYIVHEADLDLKELLG